MRTIYLVLALPLLPCLALLIYVLGWIPGEGMLVAALLVMASVEAVIVISLARTGHQGTRALSAFAQSSVLYADGLITILPDRIIFHRYFVRSSREVLFSDLDAVRALPPTLKNGKWRLSGTGDFETWFATDWCRFSRDTIFIAETKRLGDYRVGFTVKDSASVRRILKDVGMLQPICANCHYDLRGSSGRCPECGAEMQGG